MSRLDYSELEPSDAAEPWIIRRKSLERDVVDKYVRRASEPYHPEQDPYSDNQRGWLAISIVLAKLAGSTYVTNLS